MSLADWNVRKGCIGVLNSEIKYEGNYALEQPDEESVITHKQLDTDKTNYAKVSVYTYLPSDTSKAGIAIKVQDDNTGLIIRISL